MISQFFTPSACLPACLSVCLLHRKLVALAEQLAALDEELAPAGDAGLACADLVSYYRISAACGALAACACIGRSVGLPRSDTFRLAAATRVVFGAGAAVLRGYLQPSTMSPGTQTAAFQLASRQVMAVHTLMTRHLQPHVQPDLAAVFARTAGQPAAILPWIAAISEAILASPPAHDGAAASGAGMHACCSCCWSIPDGTRHVNATTAADGCPGLPLCSPELGGCINIYGAGAHDIFPRLCGV